MKVVVAELEVSLALVFSIYLLTFIYNFLNITVLIHSQEKKLDLVFLNGYGYFV